MNERDALIADTIAYLRNLPATHVLGGKAPSPVEQTPKKAPLQLRKKIHRASPPVEKKIEPKQADTPPPPQTSIELKPIKHPTKSPLSSSMRAVFQSLSIPFRDAPPSDANAKRIRFAWQEKNHIPDVIILTWGTKSAPFLSALAEAISIRLAPARLLDGALYEREKKWDLLLQVKNLRYIIMLDALLFELPNLMAHYRELPQKKQRYLGDTPVLLLPDLSLYEKDPSLKPTLWKMLCQILPKNSPE